MAPRFDLSRERAEREIAAVNQAIKEGYSAFPVAGNTGEKSALRAAAEALGEKPLSLRNRVGTPKAGGTWKKLFKLEPDWNAQPDNPFALGHDVPPVGTSTGHTWELISNKDNTFRFAAFGDLHAGSKYCRYEVREELTRRAEKFKAQCIFDTGNWIDGEKSFNRYDLEASGLDNQIRMLASRYPKTKIPTYAITGADHEGWYCKSEGIDVGRYCETVMRDYGHQWTNLGYMQADILLKNANTGKTATLRVMHPGGGSSYAISYRPQKILEAMEGGEKPSILLLGHYHKLDAGLIRNVWYGQTGCGQDQTPFMAQKALEAHVGGLLIECEQDPETGSIISYTPHLRRYFNRAYYFKTGKANNRWSGSGPVKPAPRGVQA